MAIATTRRSRSTTLLAVALVALAACGSSASSSKPTSATAMTLTAPWSGTIDKKYTCNGGSSRPDLAWTGVPAKTKQLVLVMVDTSAGYLHWFMTDIAPTVTSIRSGEAPSGAKLVKNLAGEFGYVAPCPEANTNTYVLALYALDKPIKNLNTILFPGQLIAALDAGNIGKAEVTATYTGVSSSS
jgi:Raf kinase inhibitor-like YbhB/YbcL family protein